MIKKGVIKKKLNMKKKRLLLNLKYGDVTYLI
jgi:hypothetical protein